jgi:hypothetical protein
MKLALFYMSKDMYSHDCEYHRAAKVNQPEQDLFDYFVSEWGSSRAAIRMYIVDEETLSMTLSKELLRPLKTKIVINAKKVPTPKEEVKAFKWADLTTTSAVQAQITAIQQEMALNSQWPTIPNPLP